MGLGTISCYQGINHEVYQTNDSFALIHISTEAISQSQKGWANSVMHWREFEVYENFVISDSRIFFAQLTI